MSLFEASFQSLNSRECPQWFRDAKLGIWSHWGPQSVPMYGDWYARNMYIEGTPQYLYHLRRYGHPSEFGYKDLCKLWTAENFEPEALMQKYKQAGARYFVAQAMHHDHFFNFPSNFNPMNAVNVGPRKDICGLWKAAADKQGLRFGLTEHLGASFTWWNVNKGSDREGPYAGVPYDGNDPAWRDFYFDNYQYTAEGQATDADWYTDNEQFQQYWLAVMKEMIDLYKPDLLYTDGSLPFGPHWHSSPSGSSIKGPDEMYRYGLEAVAYLYNTSIRLHGSNQAIYTQKDRNPQVYSVGIMDIEKSQVPGMANEPWQTDTCNGNWFYDVRQPFKKLAQVIEMLVDIVSKNGCMLLNILQKPDGSLDRETHHLLDELSAWMKISAEGIHDTRPFKVFGEGETKVFINGFEEKRADWMPSDIRFTTKPGVVYAHLMAHPENGTAIIKSLNEGEQVKTVRLLGHGEVPFTHQYGVLLAQMPDKMPSPYVNSLAIQLA